MFDKLKQFNQLRELRNQLKQEKSEIERDGVRIVVNGNMEIEEIVLNSDLDIKRQEKAIKNAVNDAMRKSQIAAAKKMKGVDLSGFGNLGL